MLCRAWLRKGATFHFRSNSQSLMGKQDVSWWSDPETDEWSPRLILDPRTSSLYSKLCNFNSITNRCEFKSTVVLDEDLECDGSCTARRANWDGPGIESPCECSIDMPRTVRIDHSPTSAPVWYEYVMEPCIQMAFAGSDNLNAVREIGASSSYGNKAMCADNRLPVAGTVCCDADGLNPRTICVFKGERSTYKTSQDRCAAYRTGWQVRLFLFACRRVESSQVTVTHNHMRFPFQDMRMEHCAHRLGMWYRYSILSR